MKCLEVCTHILVHTVLGGVGANAAPDRGIYSYGVPREPVFGVGNGPSCRLSGMCGGCCVAAG